MPSGAVHSLLTKKVIESLAPERRAILASEIEPLCAEYCRYPDIYYGVPEPTGQYLCFIDGEPFHYIPHEAVEYNNWKMEQGPEGPKLTATPLSENVHHRHCRTGFTFYFERIADALSSGRNDEAARFLGAVFHVLQDNTIPVHVLEGSDGVDIFTLDRLIPPPPDQPYLVPSLLLGQNSLTEDPGPRAYSPRLLGTTPAEAAFHTYTHFCRTASANRFHILPLVSALYAKDNATADSHWRAIYHSTLNLLEDFLHTSFAIASGQFDTSQLAALQKTPLEKVRAARSPRHTSPPYRFTPFIDGWSLNANRELVPLALQWNGKARQYQNGLGMGAHAWFAFDYELPPGIFSRLTGSLGLHADLGIGGHVRMRWLHNGTPVWEEEFSDDNRSANFDLDVRKGGWWTLEGRSLLQPHSKENQLVLAEPLLIRS